MLSRSRICLAAEIAKVPLITAGPPESTGCQLMRGRRGTGGLEGLVMCCRVTAVSGGPSIANTGARLRVVVWVTCGAAA